MEADTSEAPVVVNNMPEWVVVQEQSQIKPGIFESKLNLDLEDQAKFVRSVLKTPGRYLNKNNPDYDITDLDYKLIDFIENSKDLATLMGIVVDHVFQNSDKYNYNLSAQGGINGRNNVDFLIEAMAGSKSAMLNAMRALETKSLEETRKILGILVDNAGYVTVLNDVRAQLRESEEPQLMRVGRILMGLDPDDNSRPFHVQLADVYKALKFENYKPNLDAIERELNFIRGVIVNECADRPEPIKILDVGCGTGRISNGLGEDERFQVTAIDESETNLETARKANSNNLVEYKLESITNNDIPDASMDCVIITGRTIPHAEDVEGFLNWIHEIKRILKPGGIIIFDSPNPDKGRYFKNRKNFVKILQGLEIPISTEFGLNNYPYLIDSPDDQNFYNRIVLSEDAIIDLTGWDGFNTSVVMREPIYQDTDDESIYYLSKYDGVKRNSFNWTSRIAQTNF